MRHTLEELAILPGSSYRWVERLTAERASCIAALERDKAGRENVTSIDATKLKAFGELMRTRLTGGEVQIRKAYLSALIERIKVGDDAIHIFGQKTILRQQVATGIRASTDVRSIVRKMARRCRQELLNLGVAAIS